MNRDDRGQATVEFVLCLPFVLLLAAILVEITLVGADRARVWHAAREAARVAVVDPDATAASRAAARVAPGPLEVEIDPPPHLRRQGDDLLAVVAHRHEGSIPLVGRLFDDIELRAEATMRIEVP